MPFPSSPTPGDSYTDAYGTVWIYAGSVNGWYRQQVIPGNETTYTGGGSGSATATGAAGEIQFTDGTNLAASPNLLWDDANDELEVTGDLKLLDGGSFTTTLQTITPTANRTVSIPDATGTLALVAGSSGQLLYNNAGANAGVSTMTFDGTSVTLAGRLINSYTSVASSPAKVFTGTWFTGGTATTTKPHFLIEPTGTTSTAWSTSGTGLGVNAASGFAGNLLDLQVNGTSRLKFTGNFLQLGNQTTGLEYYNNGIILAANNTYASWLTSTELRLLPTLQISWAASGTTAYGVSADIGLTRSGTNTLKVTNGSTGDGTISGQLRAVGTAPANATATGTAGDIRYDADYIYVCTATNTWKRAALATW